MIKHLPLFDTKFIEQHCTEKDSVPVKYVCTTAKDMSITFGDIFYRETPHPTFGNRYFIIFLDSNGIPFISKADWVEELTFDMIYSGGNHYYSRHRHDFIQTGVGFIDGGRAYTRVGGNPLPKITQFKVINGNMEKVK